MKNNKKMTRKTKVEKRRQLLSKAYDRREARHTEYGFDSAIALAQTWQRRMVAVVLAIVFVLTTVVIGISFSTKASEVYGKEDCPVTMKVLVNDEWLMHRDDTSTYVEVQFPSALVEEGALANGIDYQKKDEKGTVLVDSIHNIIDQQVFGNQDDLQETNQKHVDYLASYVQKENGESEEILNVKTHDETIYYLTKSAVEIGSSVSDGLWTELTETDTLILSFANTYSVPSVVEAKDNGAILEAVDDIVNVESDGTISDVNGALPIAIKGLFKSPAMKATHLEAVDFLVLYNSSPRDDLQISVPAGNVETNMGTSTVKTQEEAKLYSSAVWKKAVVWKWDSSDNTYIQYDVENVGKYDDNIYYSVEGDNEDTGILLGTNDKLYLQYDLFFNVSYVLSPNEGGNVVGSATKVAYGKSLPVNINTNTYYQLSALTYNIQTSPSSYKYGTAQPVSNQTIPASEIVGDVIVYASFTKDTQYYIDANGITHGHVCAQHSVEYVPDSGTNDDIAQWGDTDSESGIKHGVTVSAGGTAYLVMFAQKSTSSTDAYFLNAIWLNNEEVKVPTSYSYSAGDASCIATTTLSNGSVVTVSLVSDLNDSHLRNNSNTSRLRYIIKITDVKENIDMKVYFRPYAKTLMYLKGLRGIANTSAAYPLDTYLRFANLKPWELIGDYAKNNANNALYFLDENNTSKPIAHMYSSYNTQKLKEQVENDRHLDDAVLSLGHNLDHFHFHNVYLVKVKPGYNSNHITYTDLLCNYNRTIGDRLLSNKKTIEVNQSTTNSSFLSDYDEMDYWQHATLGSTKYYYYYCNWDTQMTDSNIATGSISIGRYSVLTNEVPKDSFWDSNTTAAIKTYTPFLSGAKRQHYYNGVMLPELEYYNNSLEINAFAYKYKIQYFVNGQDQNGQPVMATYNDLDTSTHEFESGNTSFKEINRHAVEIASNPSSSAITNEFEGVVADDVVIPEEPDAIQNDNYRYSFQYWKLVKCNPATGEYVSDVTKNGKVLKYTPGELFSLTNDAVGVYHASGSTLTGYNISLADYDVVSGDASSGYAWGDYNSTDDNALTFTFMPVWQSEPIGDYQNYSVLAYKDTAINALKDGDDNLITTIQNGKTYYLFYRNGTNKAAPGSEIVSLNQHYPADGLTYNLNEDLTDEKINHLEVGVDDQIVYFYDAANLPVTIRETVDGNYSNDDDTFNVTLTLIPPSSVDASTLADRISLNEEVIASKQDDNTYTASLSNLIGDGSKTNISIPYGYTLKVSSISAGNPFYAAPTMKYAQGEEPDAFSGTEFTSETELLITQNTDILIHNICDEIPITGISNGKKMIGFVLMGIVIITIIAGAIYIYHRKDEFIEQ